MLGGPVNTYDGGLAAGFPGLVLTAASDDDDGVTFGDDV